MATARPASPAQTSSATSGWRTSAIVRSKADVGHPALVPGAGESRVQAEHGEEGAPGPQIGAGEADEVDGLERMTSSRVASVQTRTARTARTAPSRNSSAEADTGAVTNRPTQAQRLPAVEVEDLVVHDRQHQRGEGQPEDPDQQGPGLAAGNTPAEVG